MFPYVGLSVSRIGAIALVTLNTPHVSRIVVYHRTAGNESLSLDYDLPGWGRAGTAVTYKNVLYR